MVSMLPSNEARCRPNSPPPQAAGFFPLHFQAAYVFAACNKRTRDQQKQGKALREEAAKWLVRIAAVAKTRAFLILRVAEDDSAVVLADFNGHNPIVALSSLEHGDSKVFRDLLGVESHLVDDALSSIPDDSVGHCGSPTFRRSI